MKMKTVALRNMKEGLSNYIAQAQKDYILITKHGRPSALVRGVEGCDFEDIFYMTNRAFWTTIRHRRTQKSILWSKAKRTIDT
jgi:prevent-host-death family protein